MKSILLTTTALVAFAGAAAADGHAAVSTALSGTLGFNDTDSAFNEDGTARASSDDNENGFYWEGNLKVTATAALDNGLTAGAYFEITVGEDNGTASDDGGIALSSSDFVVSLTSDTASLFFGDTSTAATKHWVSAGDMEQDGFTSDSDSAVLRGDVSIAGIDASVSYIINDAGGADASVEQLSFGAGGSFGAFTASLGYQESTTFADGADDFNANEVLGVSAGGTFAGATVTVAYATQTDAADVESNSTGIKIGYPIGPVALTAYYVLENVNDVEQDPNFGINAAYSAGAISVTADYQDDQTVQIWSVNGSYDLGNGLKVLAGAEEQSGADGAEVDFHVGAMYDLGGGASVLATYALDADGDQEDEIGSGDYQEGITVEVSFAF